MQAGKVWIENENIEKGIVQIIVQHGIRWLVMGAAAEKHYSRLKASFTVDVFIIDLCSFWF